MKENHIWPTKHFKFDNISELKLFKKVTLTLTNLITLTNLKIKKLNSKKVSLRLRSFRIGESNFFKSGMIFF